MSPDDFLTLAASAEAQTRVKASVFLASAHPAGSEEEARAILAARERAMWDATHHCSAWKLRGGISRANDAGEPNGSAGAPILAAIEGAGLTDVIVIVTRWYGGTRLGVGGLVRAYGEAAALAIEAAPRRVGTLAVRLRVRYPYAHTAAVMRVLERAGAAEVEHGYAESGDAGIAEFSVPTQAAAFVRDELREATAGALAPEPIGPRVLYRNADA
ncbi:YigZ family protein [Longimicrobium sp.]|uniref:IMPACT family protein n=1 Tax=Longimicrobium sp. TaxID=2029185 RepID=UPI002C84F9F0|nr:YigZ family protein [Longimicrobium sp.]HSU15758.1 YigZ family protein [Longimicrobium sp.]